MLMLDANLTVKRSFGSNIELSGFEREVDIKSQTTVDQDGVVYVGHTPAHIGWMRFYGQMDGLAGLESNPDALKSNTRISCSVSKSCSTFVFRWSRLPCFFQTPADRFRAQDREFRERKWFGIPEERFDSGRKDNS